jgi:SAM-dependent methyltransferase
VPAASSASTAAPTDLGSIAFSPGEEAWIEFGPPDDRRRVAFHDYAAIYSVPGLYERVFYDELGMCSAAEVVGLYGEALTGEGLGPGEQRVLDLGAGNGIGGEELRALGVAHVVGLDLEPAARDAAGRDRPGVYDDFLVGDLGAWSADELADLERRRFTALLAVAAVGAGHVPPATLRRALDLLEPGGLFGFAVTPALLPGSDDAAGRATGYPDFLTGLLADEADELGRRTYVHRRQTDGTPHDAVALVGRLR